jgi:catalase
MPIDSAPNKTPEEIAMHTSRPLSSARAAGRFLPTALAATVWSFASMTAWAADAAPAEQKATPVALVNALDKLSGGPHAGYRANHAKGIVVSGDFTPAASAASLSKAPHFAAGVPVVVRFSDTTGVPNLPDASPDASPHGIAIRFKLPGGTTTDIVSISANSFPVSTPEDFLALMQAVAQSGPGAAKPTPIEQFLGSHPAALKFVTTPRPAPQSFATLTYYGVNAFKFTNAKGESRYARYQIVPLAGERPLSEADAGKAAPDYLMQELPKRIAQGPVKFRLMAQVAKDGDKVDDATVVWPADREVVELGTLSLTTTAADQTAEQKALLFNPVSLPDGIVPSTDPILLARFPAYAVSFGQRSK